MPTRRPVSLTWSITSAAAHGTATFVGANTGASVTICYTPALDQFAADSFVVEVDDACGGPDTVTVNVTVQACPNLLVDNFDSYANQAAFDAVWFDTLNSPYYLDVAAGNPAGAVIMPSPSANSMGRFYRNLGGDFNGTDAAPLTLTYDLWLDAAGCSGLERGAALRRAPRVLGECVRLRHPREPAGHRREQRLVRYLQHDPVPGPCAQRRRRGRRWTRARPRPERPGGTR